MGSFGGATGNGSDPAVSSEMRSAADSVDTRVRIFDGSRRRKYTSVAALRRIIRADNSRVAELPNPAQATPELRQTNGYLVENDRRLAELEEHLDELIRRAASVASELSKSAQTPT
ncbi:MAG: hypothetical protein ACJ8KU_00640, partial [Chthoniobacterales bacterium]